MCYDLTLKMKCVENLLSLILRNSVYTQLISNWIATPLQTNKMKRYIGSDYIYRYGLSLCVPTFGYKVDLNRNNSTKFILHVNNQFTKKNIFLINVHFKFLYKNNQRLSKCKNVKNELILFVRWSVSLKELKSTQ